MNGCRFNSLFMSFGLAAFELKMIGTEVKFLLA
jgi:hypothetical protein